LPGLPETFGELPVEFLMRGGGYPESRAVRRARLKYGKKDGLNAGEAD